MFRVAVGASIVCFSCVVSDLPPAGSLTPDRASRCIIYLPIGRNFGPILPACQGKFASSSSSAPRPCLHVVRQRSRCCCGISSTRGKDASISLLFLPLLSPSFRFSFFAYAPDITSWNEPVISLFSSSCVFFSYFPSVSASP